MSLNSTPNGERVHIALFGRRNAGKSSLMNAITNQELAIVSKIKGTTTDPVSKAMELLPLGPVLMIDTPGIDDSGELGWMRVKKTYQVLNKTDIAIVVVDATLGFLQEEQAILKKIIEKQIPYIIAFNKADTISKEVKDHMHKQIDSFEHKGQIHKKLKSEVIFVSAKTGDNIYELKEEIARLSPSKEENLRMVADLLSPSDFVVLVVPIDKAAPKGRLILPQQQAIRDILEADATSIVVKEHELKDTLEHLKKQPRLVITDSQVFAKVAADTPKDIPLTSFSILLARYKGLLMEAVKGVKALEQLEENATILISEGCTHHRQCDDIGTVKIPRFIRQYTGKQFQYEFTSGTEFPCDLSKYQLIIHCGGCTLTEREMIYRMECAKDAHVPITNYGIMLAYLNGILRRSIAMFPAVAMLLEE